MLNFGQRHCFSFWCCLLGILFVYRFSCKLLLLLSFGSRGYMIPCFSMSELNQFTQKCYNNCVYRCLWVNKNNLFWQKFLDVYSTVKFILGKYRKLLIVTLIRQIYICCISLLSIYQISDHGKKWAFVEFMITVNGHVIDLLINL